MATDASDRDLTENGVTFRAKVMALKTVTTVKACTHKDLATLLTDSQVSPQQVVTRYTTAQTR